ncbi:MAG: dockerin type I repeat-containing protein [Clostridia bacterium]|nr:dockerin type I repeat-containing protein [Clostridia bacterium]
MKRLLKRLSALSLSLVLTVVCLSVSVKADADTFKDASVTETGQIAGDINSDGSVDNKDLIRLFKYLSDCQVDVNEDTLDVNGDNYINNKDLTRLFRYISGFEVTIYYNPVDDYQPQDNDMKIFYNSSGYDASVKYTGGAAKAANDLKNKILNAGNTEDIYTITGNKYYIKKSYSLNAIPENLSPGDAVLFERGGRWRVNECTLTVPKGVIFGAYGEGDKPKFYGSAKNYAKKGIWTDTGNNIWRANLKGGNAGIIVFNEIYPLGVKKWELSELSSFYDFYSNRSYVYLYCTDDPAKIFRSIEIGQRNEVITVKSGGVLDNVCVRYTGGHGITVHHKTENVSITNCEVGLLGGSQHHGTTRFGNGIEMQLGVKNVTTKNNYVYECYDAGITFQSWDSAELPTIYDGVYISENLIERCHYNIEFFTTQPERGGCYSELNNISIDNNILRFSGYCWSYEQRPDHWMTAQIRSSQLGWFDATDNFVINDNIFDCSRASIIYWWWHSTDGSYVYDFPHPGLCVYNNSFYEAATPDARVMGYRYERPKYAYGITTFRTAVEVFDSSPKTVVWLDTL